MAIDVLAAEFRLITTSFQSGIKEMLSSLNSVKKAMDDIGSASSGLNKATDAMSRGSAETKKASDATQEYIEKLRVQDASLKESANAHLSMREAQNELNQEMTRFVTQVEAERNAINGFKQGIFESTVQIREQEAATRKATAAQTAYIEKLLQGKALANSIQARAPTTGFGEFSVAAAAAIGQQKQLAAEAEKTAAATIRENNAFAATAAGLQRNIAIYQEAIASGQSYAQAQERIAAANKAAQFSNKAQADEIERLNLKQSEAISNLKKSEAAINSNNNAVREARTNMDKFVSALERISIFTIAASVLVRGFYQIVSALREVFVGSINFNSELEKTQFAIAAILTSTRQFATGFGEAATFTSSYAGFLEKAKALQRDILEADIRTLGTYQDLSNVFRVVLGFSSQQKATDQERLQLAENILNAGLLLGLSKQQLETEARQILSLERDQGQQILQSLGVTVDQLRVYRDHGTLIQELNNRLKAYSLLAKDIELTWEGLTSTVQTFASVISGANFKGTFQALKDILSGIGEELRNINPGTLFGGNLDSSKMKAFGQSLASALVTATKAFADLTEAAIAFTAATGPIWALLGGIVLGIIKGITLELNGLATVFYLARDAAAVFGNGFLKAVEIIFGSGVKDKVSEIFDSIADQAESLFSRMATLAGAFGLVGLIMGGAYGFVIGAAVGVVFASVEALLNKMLAQGKSASEFADGLFAIGEGLKNISGLAPETTKELDTEIHRLDTFSQTLSEIAINVQKNVKPGPDQKELLTVIKNYQSYIAALREGFEETRGNLEQNSKDFKEWSKSLNDSITSATVSIAGLKAANEAIREGLKAGLSKGDIEVNVARAKAEAEAYASAAQKHVQADATVVKAAGDAAAEQEKYRQENKRLTDSMDPKKIEAQGKAVDQIAKQTADAVNKQAQAERDYAKAVAQATGDVAGYRAAALLAVKTNLDKEIAAHAHNEEAIVALRKAGAIEQMKALADVTNFEIQQLDKTQKRIEDQIRLRGEQAAAVRAAADAIRGAEIGALNEELSAIKEHSGTYNEQIALIRQIGQLQVANAQSALDGYNEQINKTNELIQTEQQEIQKLQEKQAAAQLANDALSSAEIATALEAETGKVTALTNELTKLQGQAAAAGITLTTTAQRSAQELNNAQTTVVHFGDTIKGSIDQVFNGLIQGTLKFKDVFSSFALGIGRAFASGFADALTKKAGFDVIFQNNIQGLGGLLSNFASGIGQVFTGIFGQAGSGVTSAISDIGGIISSGAKAIGIDFGSIFGTSAASSASGTFSPDLAAQLGLPDLAAPAGTTFGSLFGSVAAGAAGLAFGKVFSNALGFGKSGSSQTGGNIGGLIGGISGAIGGSLFGSPQLGAAIGSFIGNVLGSLFGSLFEHIPTAGTQIRKSVIDYLKEIKVSFINELNSKQYFFEESKALAKEMFGGDFLAASEQILKQEAGPKLSKQLQALGVFLTADSASKLGKSIEQTGTTFGNMLIDGLGIKKIPDAIKEIISKGNISFDAMAQKLTEVFQEGKISAEFYNDTIQGMVDIFYGDLPAAINASKIALDSFKEGIFDIDTFKEKLKNATDVYDLVIQQATDAIKNSKTGEEAAKAFGDGLKQGLANLAIDQYLQKFFKENLFAGIDLSNGLDQGEIDLMRERIRGATEDVNKLKVAFDDASSAVGDMVSQVATDVLKSGALGEDVGKAFIEGVQKGLADMAIQSYIQSFLKDTLFVGIDLTNGLDQGEIDLMRERIRGAATDVEKLRAAFVETGAAAKDMVSQIATDVLNSGAMGQDAGQAFMEGVKNGLADMAIQAYIQKFLKDTLFVGIDLSNGLDHGEIDLMRGRIEKASGDVAKLRREFNDTNAVIDTFMSHFDNLGTGLSGSINNYIKSLKDLKQQLKDQVLTQEDVQRQGLSRTNPLKEQILELEQKGIGTTLGDEIGSQIGDAVTQAIMDAIINEAIINAVIKPFTDQLSALVKQSMADGILTPEEQAAIANLGKDAANAGRDAANAIAPAIQGAVDAGDSIKNNSTITADQFTSVKVSAGAASDSLADAAGPIEDAAASLLGAQNTLKGLKDELNAASLTTVLDQAKEMVDLAGEVQTLMKDTTLAAVVEQAKTIRDALVEAANALSNVKIPVPTGPGHAGGGQISGYGGGDKIPAMLEAGEYIIPKDKALKYADLIQMIMGDQARHFAMGGPVLHMATGGNADESPYPGQNRTDFFTILSDFIKEAAKNVSTIAELKKTFESFAPYAQLLADLKSKGDNLSKAQKEQVAALEKAVTALNNVKDKVIKDFLAPIYEFIGKETGNPFADLTKQAEDLKKSLTTNAEFLKKMGVNVDGLMKEIDKSLRAKLEKLKDDLLSPIYDFIGKSDPFSELIKQADDLRKSLLANAEVLKKLGVNVDDLMKEIDKSLRAKLVKLKDDLLSPIYDFVGKSDPFSELIKQADELKKSLLANAPFLKKMGVDIDSLITDISKSLNEKLLKLKNDILGPIFDFLGKTDPFSALRKQADDLKKSLLDNAEMLKKLGVDVPKMIADIEQAFKEKLLQMKADLLDPIDQAIKGINPGNLGKIDEVFKQIGSAKNLKDLETLRDKGIAIIKDRLDKQTQLEKDASEKRIQALKDEANKKIDAIKKDQSAAQELFQLRQKQLQEELAKVKELRDVGLSLIEASKSLTLSDLSPLKPQDRFNEALNEFNDLAKKAKGGDIEAAKKLAASGQTLLAEAQKMFASSPAFQAIFKLVQDTLANTGKNLVTQADIQQKQLDKLNNLQTDAERIAELQKQLHLTGKESLQQLKNLDKTFQDQIDKINKGLEAAIKKEEETLKLKLQALNDAAVKELRDLRDRLSEKFDTLIKKFSERPNPIPGPITQNADDMANAIVRALAKNPQQPQMISIPIQVVTADGEVIAQTVLNRLATDSSNGKIVINSKGAGRTGRF